MAPLIVIWLICGVLAGSIATNKGLSGGSFFLVGVLLGPLGIVIALVVKGEPEQVAAAAPARWATDPYGKHQHRYWDGHQWTEHVSDAGVPAVDAGVPAVDP